MFHDLRNSSKRRHGFTLVELLVVIAIIAILASLAAWGVFAMIGVRQKNNTEATIRVVNKLMQSRWSAVIADAKKERPSQSVMNLAAGDKERAQVIWIKVRLAEAFPSSYWEMHPTDPKTIVNRYITGQAPLKAHFTKYRSTVTSYGATPSESSACLLMALKTLGSDGGVAVQDQLNYAVADTNGDGIPEFVDSWGNPLVFVRFPSGPDLQAAYPGGNTKFADPIDTGGHLINKNWYWWNPSPPNPTPRQIFEVQFHAVGPAPAIVGQPPAKAFFVTPVIVSAGKDGAMNTADDIFSFKLRGD